MSDEATPAKKSKAKKADAPEGIWRPKGEEFTLDGDFAEIASGLGVDVDAVEFALTDEERDGVAGHTLTGAAK